MTFRKLLNEELNRISTEEFKNAEKLPVSIILDNVRSLNNIGSIFRTADAFRIEKIWLCGITATPPNREIHKTALGAEDSIDWEYSGSTVEVVKKLKQAGYLIYSAEQAENSISLETFRLQPEQKYAIIFGNEIKGVQQEAVDLSDGCLEIPQFGTKHSFNISVSAGIVLWQIVTPFLSKLK
ncbi:MAG: RNA methyltransferase [Culturomica sp.]|jgi:tRNA G18 (ribose-2'-O)-methylase SpoU|nr:RNA methyltransferase [Culturomica sp.]